MSHSRPLDRISHHISKKMDWAAMVASLLVCACSSDSVSVSSEQCGNGMLDDGEICDGERFSPNASCLEGLHLPEGASLSCKEDCSLNTDACIPAISTVPCGNGVLDDGEICDGEKYSKDAKCQNGLHLPEGARLSCNADCSLNTDACVKDDEPIVEPPKTCGNDRLDEGEECDGNQIHNTASCPKGMHLPDGKSFACHENCTLDTSDCEITISTTIPQGRVVPNKEYAADLTEIPLHRTPQHVFPNKDLYADREDEPSQIVINVPKDTVLDIIGSVGSKWLVKYNGEEGYIHSMHVQHVNDLEIPKLDFSSPSTNNYYQKNKDWEDEPVGTVGTIGTHGGVPVAVADAVASFKGSSITPKVIASKIDTYLGKTSDYICQLVKNEYQLDCEYLDNNKGMNGGDNTTNDATTRQNAKAKMQEAFKNGWYVIAEEGCGESTYWGNKRTILVYGYDKENDRVYVDDPQNRHYMEDKGIESFLNCNHTMSIITNMKYCLPKTCQDLDVECGENLDDGCGGKLNCTCEGGNVCINASCTTNKDVYPVRKSIKGIQPDNADTQTLINNNVHGVVFNMVWEDLQKSKHSDCVAGEVKYKGYCYKTNYVDKIKEFTDAGVVVTAIVYGVPEWARINNDICTAKDQNGNYKYVQKPHFCIAKEEYADDYGRFAGFLAWYFNGIEHDGNKGGRIADFVIHNEVNCAHWYNMGCKDVNDCQLDSWVARYAMDWNKAYDYIRAEQKQAKVLISFDHIFAFDAGQHKSVEQFLSQLVPKLGNREWRLAFHSYPPDLGNPVFSANDWPRITFGNIGVLAGWLRQKYHDKPYAWEIHLTENGLNGNPSNSNQLNLQNEYLCKAFQNVLGTPGIESFIYHRYQDYSIEKIFLGLFTEDAKNEKPAWKTYRDVNKPGAEKCGFQLLPYIELKRYYNESNGYHWVTTRMPPAGFGYERSWKTFRDKPNFGDPVMLYECRVGGANGSHTMISTFVDCEKEFNMGPMGYAFKTHQDGTVPLYRCRTGSGSHFVTENPNCENQTKEDLVVYVYKCPECKH